MGKIASINEGKFLGSYAEAGSKEWIPDGIYFAAGVVITVALPQLFYSVYGGIVPLVAFLGSSLAGLTLGLIIRRLAPYTITSCVGMGTVPQAPPEEEVRSKAA